MTEPGAGACTPTRLDLGVALVVLVVCLLPLAVGSRSDMLEVDPAGPLSVLGLVASVLLVVRRRYLWHVWAATTVVGLLAVGVAAGPTPAYLAAAVALYTVGVRSAPVRSIAAALVSVVAPVVVVLVSRGNAVDSVAFGMTGWSVVALASGIAVRSQRAAVESAQERARLAEETREEEAQRRVTEERLRIARELHDVVAHHVAVINVQAGVASYLVRTDPDGASSAMAHVREASQTVLGEVAVLLGLLRSGDEVETAPVPRLAEVDALVERLRRSGAQVVLQSEGLPRETTPVIDLTAYRVVQEALTNAVRHGTGRVAVRLAADGSTLTVDVRNPRRLGTATDHPDADPRRGHGLVGMRERVTAVGGTLRAGAEGAAWVVNVTLPLGPAPAVVPELAAAGARTTTTDPAR